MGNLLRHKWKKACSFSCNFQETYIDKIRLHWRLVLKKRLSQRFWPLTINKDEWYMRFGAWKMFCQPYLSFHLWIISFTFLDVGEETLFTQMFIKFRYISSRCQLLLIIRDEFDQAKSSLGQFEFRLKL